MEGFFDGDFIGIFRKNTTVNYRTIILFFICISSASARSLNIDTMPLHRYNFSTEILDKYASGELRSGQPAVHYSFIGEYFKALSFPNEVEIEWNFDTLTQKDRRYFEQFSSKNAFEAIIDRAENEKIIIINEAHHKPLHRVFVRLLLKGLYSKGYRVLCLEALNNCQVKTWAECDSTLNARGYPVSSPLSGYYIVEPQMGNLIREAIRLGFTVRSYEQTGEDRELNQAKNIKKIIEEYPYDKVLVLCGWYHLLEEENQNQTWMASHLRGITGINPFTIYQDILIERVATPESPFMEMMNYDEPTIFVDPQNSLYNGFPDNKLFDALVYHPRTKYLYNRPDWLLWDKNNKVYFFDDLGENYPYLIKAYKKEEGLEAVPIDIIEKSYKGDTKALILPPGKYILQVRDLKGNEKLKEIVVN